MVRSMVRRIPTVGRYGARIVCHQLRAEGRHTSRVADMISVCVGRGICCRVRCRVRRSGRANMVIGRSIKGGGLIRRGPSFVSSRARGGAQRRQSSWIGLVPRCDSNRSLSIHSRVGRLRGVPGLIVIRKRRLWSCHRFEQVESVIQSICTDPRLTSIVRLPLIIIRLVVVESSGRSSGL
jgi:hypothetical protein